MKLFKIKFTLEIAGECLVISDSADLAGDEFISKIRSAAGDLIRYLEIKKIEEVSLGEKNVFWFNEGLYT